MLPSKWLGEGDTFLRFTSFEKKFNVPSDLQYLVSDSNYLIVYRVVGQIVEVLYIIDGRSNYLAWLFGI